MRGPARRQERGPARVGGRLPGAPTPPRTEEGPGADLVRTTAGRTAIVTSHRPEVFPGLPQLRLPAAEPRAHLHHRGAAAAVLSAVDASGRAAP